MSLKKLASLIVKISANGAQAQAEFRKLEKSAQNFGKSMKRIGNNMTKYVTAPLVALGAVSVKVANTQLQAEAKLLNALKGREDVQKRLMEQASKTQSRTLFGDEAIIEQQAYLAALGLSEQQINDTIEAAVQLSAALGMELTSAVKNLAKTYGGMTGELGESIPALKNFTQEQLKAGDAIGYVNANYKGFAESAAGTGTGSLTQLQNKLGDLAEKIGAVLIPVLEKVVVVLEKFVDALSKLPDGAQTAVVGFGVIAAATGPVIMAIGSIISNLKLIIPAIASVKTAMVSAFSAGGPIFVAVAAVVSMLAEMYNMTKRLDQWSKEWSNKLTEENRQREEAAYQGVKDRYYGKTYEEDVLNANGEVLIPKGFVVKPDIDLEYWDKQVEKLEAEYRAMDRLVNNPALLTEEDQMLLYKKFGTTPYADAKALLGPTKAELDGIRRALKEIREGKSPEVISHDTIEQVETATGLIEQLQAKIAELEDKKLLATSKEEIGAINTELVVLNKELDELVKYRPANFDASGIATKGVNFGVSGPKMAPLEGMGVTEKQTTAWIETQKKQYERMQAVVKEMNDALSNAVASAAVGVGEMLGDLITGEEFNPIQRLLEMLGKLLKDLGTALITYAGLIEAFKKTFKNPYAAIAVGVAAVAAGQVFMNLAKKPIKLAQGGLAYGPTMAVVGDNPGAANDPEVVAPLSKLRDYMGRQRLELTGEIEWELRGDVLRAVLDRENLRLATLGR